MLHRHVYVAAAVLCAVAAPLFADIVSGTEYTPVTQLSAFYNYRLSDLDPGFPGAAPDQNGLTKLGGVPFSIPTEGDNLFRGSTTDNDIELLDMRVNVDGPMKVHTLINTWWGTTLCRASVTFYFAEGDPYRVLLYGNEHIRDYNQYHLWTNNLASEDASQGMTMENVVSVPRLSDNYLPADSVEHRMDMQTIELPLIYNADTLTRIVVKDWGGWYYDPATGSGYAQRLLVSGITVENNPNLVPEPATLAVLLGGSGMLVIRRRR